MNLTLDFHDVFSYWTLLLAGTELTLLLSVSSVIIGLCIAIPGAWARISGPILLKKAFGIYIEIIRNTPLLVQIYLVFFALPALGIRLSPNVAALVALSLNFGAYSIEIIRAGLQSIDRGQTDAGRALGLSGYQIFTLILLRPAVRNIFPALTSQFILLMLGSAMVSIISTNELTGAANYIQSLTFRSFEVYLVAAAIYLFLSIVLTSISSIIYKAFIAYPAH